MADEVTVRSRYRSRAAGAGSVPAVPLADEPDPPALSRPGTGLDRGAGGACCLQHLKSQLVLSLGARSPILKGGIANTRCHPHGRRADPPP